ncbi:hypothetical protein FBQ85_28050 [Cytophagia bacterium CHB2]|nr:hypothetical protein [Cytophagia bacterium CHB2]
MLKSAAGKFSKAIRWSLLRQARLRQARLRQARLRQARLRQARLRQAQPPPPTRALRRCNRTRSCGPAWPVHFVKRGSKKSCAAQQRGRSCVIMSNSRSADKFSHQVPKIFTAIKSKYPHLKNQERDHMKRRYALLWLLLGATLAYATDQNDAKLREKANHLAQKLLIVDTHVDVPYRMREKVEDISMRTAGGDFDYVRAKEGGLNAPFMSIYVPSEYEPKGLAKARFQLKKVDAVIPVNR